MVRRLRVARFMEARCDWYVWCQASLRSSMRDVVQAHLASRPGRRRAPCSHGARTGPARLTPGRPASSASSRASVDSRHCLLTAIGLSGGWDIECTIDSLRPPDLVPRTFEVGRPFAFATFPVGGVAYRFASRPPKGLSLCRSIEIPRRCGTSRPRGGWPKQ